jgi:hypothetical protein
MLKKLEERGVITDEERRNLSQGNGGETNPEFLEYLMGYPAGWTETMIPTPTARDYKGSNSAEHLMRGGCQPQKESRDTACQLGEAVPDTESTECERHEQRTEPARIAGFTDDSWWPAEPGVGRVAHGIPNRVDRIKCLGNAVVPQQFYPFFAAIAEIERSKQQ